MPKAEITVTTRLKDQDVPHIEKQTVDFTDETQLAGIMVSKLAEIRANGGLVEIMGQGEEFRYVPIERILDVRVTRTISLLDESTNVNAAAAQAQTSHATDAALRGKQPIPFVRR